MSSTVLATFLLSLACPAVALANPPASPPNGGDSAESPATSEVPAELPIAAENSPPEAPPASESSIPDKPAETPTNVEPPPPRKGLPRLHVEANRPGVRLIRIERAMSDDMGEGLLIKTVCSAPCDQVIDGRKRQTFFFGADGMVPSRGFRLAKLDGNIVAHVQGGSLVARQMGYLVGAFGGAAVIGGATMLGVGYARNDTHLSSEGKVVEGPNPALTTGGAIVLGVGAAMVTTAIVLVLTAKTKITLMHADDNSARISLEMGTLRF